MSIKVSFDLDGVLYEKPTVWIPLCKAIKLAGGKIGVLSGHTHNSKDRVFAKLEIMGYPKFDFFFGRREEDMPFNGAVRKSQVIKDEDIDIHFDDYDYDFVDTVKLFAELGQEDKVLRVRSVESGKLGHQAI